MAESWKKILTVLSFAALLISSNNSYVCSQEYNSVQNDFSDYMTSLKEKIHKMWIPPEVLEEGHAVVIFKLDRSGEIVSTRVEESSGNEVFDASALDVLAKASPFGEFPNSSNRDYITIKYSFDSSIVKTDKMKEYVENAEKLYNINNQMALHYIDLAIKEIEGDSACYFLYARRYKINKALGNIQSAESDLQECKRLKPIYDKKRINACKLNVETEGTPFSYFALANAYDAAGDYSNAINALNQAIKMTPLNNTYKRYRAEIILKSKELEQ